LTSGRGVSTGTPAPIITRLNQEINRAMQLPEIKEKLEAAGLIIVNESPGFFKTTIDNDYEKYGKVIRETGLTGKL